MDLGYSVNLLFHLMADLTFNSICHVDQVMVNTACCVLMLIAKVIQCIVFGPLRVSEKQVSRNVFGVFLGNVIR
jgi:hypothetical protein